MPREKVESTDQGQNCQNHEWNEHAGGRFTARPGSGGARLAEENDDKQSHHVKCGQECSKQG